MEVFDPVGMDFSTRSIDCERTVPERHSPFKTLAPNVGHEVPKEIRDYSQPQTKIPDESITNRANRIIIPGREVRNQDNELKINLANGKRTAENEKFGSDAEERQLTGEKYRDDN